MNEPYHIWLVSRDEEIDRCFPVMVQLRPHLARREFVERIQQMQTEGYRLAALEQRGVIRAVAGFRVFDVLHRGRNLYVDDLVTDQDARSTGHGAALLNWLKERARAEGCDTLDLDSGVQPSGAHRFYFRQGMAITSYHFSVDLKA
jgi:GNAT superfamily N-acetyltransferase